MQLISYRRMRGVGLAGAFAAAGLLAGVAAGVAHAEDRADTTVTFFQERRAVGNSSLQVVNPQFDVGFDLGPHVGISAGYEADIVSGATPNLYAAPPPGQTIDAVTTASQFHDTRQSGHGGLSLRGRRSTLDLGYIYGTERDYQSQTVTAAGTVDLPGKNTTFGLAYAHNFDQVCDLDNGMAEPLERQPLTGANACFTSDPKAKTITRDVAIDTTDATLTQNLSPTWVLQLGAHGQIVRGLQSNPYRRVRVAGIDAQEHEPEVRDRGSVYARANWALPSAHSAFSFWLRFYSDTWGVNAGTAEVEYHQYVGKRVLFRLRARGYQQTGATFFRDAIELENRGAPGQYFTGDRELSPFRDFLGGAKMSYLATGQDGRQVWGLFDEVDLHLSAEGLWFEALTPTPPGGVNSGSLPDAITVSLGLLLRY